MTSENSQIFDELKFQLELMHLLDGCEQPCAAKPGAGASAAAVLAADLTQVSPALQ